jgi:hypothetical protein
MQIYVIKIKTQISKIITYKIVIHLIEHLHNVHLIIIIIMTIKSYKIIKN